MLLTRVGLRSWIAIDLHRSPLGCPSKASARTETTSSITSATSNSPERALENVNDGSAKDVKVDGLFYLDSVFPIRLGTWEFVLFSKAMYVHLANIQIYTSLRHYMAIFQKEPLAERLEDIFREVRVHHFEVQSVEPRLGLLFIASAELFNCCVTG